jgi:TolA-binding protein
MTTNGKMNGWLKLLGAITGLILSMLALFFTMVKPAVSDAVAEQVKVESVQREEAIMKNYGEHKALEDRLEKRLDRMEGKIDRLVERANR